MSLGQLGRKKFVVALVALLVAAVVATAALSGDLNLTGQQTYPTATVGGRIVGKAFTEGNAVGNVTGIFFGAMSNSTQGKGSPADVKGDGTYSIRLTNGMNYSVYIYVVDPNNDEDTGICQGQELFLNNLHQSAYGFDITPVNCA